MYVDCYESGLRSIAGIISGSALTVSLFTSRVPETARWLTILNHPVFIIVFAAMMILISRLAGNLSAKAVAYWGSVSEEATEGNRLFSFFGFIGLKKNRNADIRMYNQQNLVSAYWRKNSEFGAAGNHAELVADENGKYYELWNAQAQYYTE